MKAHQLLFTAVGALLSLGLATSAAAEPFALTRTQPRVILFPTFPLLGTTTVREVDTQMGKFDFARRPTNAACQIYIPLFPIAPVGPCTFDASGRPTNSPMVSLTGRFDYSSGDGLDIYGATIAMIDNGIRQNGVDNDFNFWVGFEPTGAGQTLLRMQGWSGTVPNGFARAEIVYRHGQRAVLPADAVRVVLEKQDAGGSWIQVGRAGSSVRMDDSVPYYETRVMTAGGNVEANTPIRLEVRSNLPGGHFDLMEVHLVTQDCTQDPTNPEQCL